MKNHQKSFNTFVHPSYKQDQMKKASILGAIAGDVIGSIYEFNPTKDYHFELLNEHMEITDDSIMTIAVADWILHDHTSNPTMLAERMRYWGNKYRYPMGGYGGTFSGWLSRKDMGPYHSWGNGSAMRVSAVGFAGTTLQDVLRIARISAEVTHNHPEGIKGAQSTAAAIFMSRTGASKKAIRQYITQQFGYDLSKTCNDIRPTYAFEPSCQDTVPQSLVAFFDSKDYEDAIRLTVSLGGDADTMGAITGAVAAAFYKGIPDKIYDFVMARIPDDLKKVVLEFEHHASIMARPSDDNL